MKPKTPPTTRLSIAQRIALLTPEEQTAALEGIDPDEILHDWTFWARPEQQQPPGNWGTWLFCAGRGAGKTRSAAEWIHERVRAGHAKRIILLGRTAADVRDVMVNGDSGLMNTGRPHERPEYFSSKRLVVWPNGAQALLFSADEPDQLRGPQGDTAWCIAENTPVITRRGPVEIQNVTVGDQVMTRVGWQHVTATRATGTKPVLAIHISNGATLRCTADHKVWTDTGWVEAGQLQPGDTVTNVGEKASVLHVEPDGSSPTHDLTVRNAHEFYANGILVHNCDEFATFPGSVGTDGLTAFDNLRFAVRLPVPGDVPRTILTTTPRRVPAMYKILEDAQNPDLGIVVTTGSTYDNLANLADTFRSTILNLYEGTNLGRQELLGEMLDDVEGALFRQVDFDTNRVPELPVARMVTVVGVDPSVAERPKDECGIVVVRATLDRDLSRRQVYVVEDASILGSPAIWSKKVADTARKWGASVVAEGNQGGELVRMSIAQADANLPVHIVHARTGKATRAEPVAALSESGRLHMVGWLPLLEGQMASWVPGGRGGSPDRLDACVWAVLAVTTRQRGLPSGLGRDLRAKSTSQHRMPSLSASMLSSKSGNRRR